MGKPIISWKKLALSWKVFPVRAIISGREFDQLLPAFISASVVLAPFVVSGYWSRKQQSQYRILWSERLVLWRQLLPYFEFPGQYPQGNFLYLSYSQCYPVFLVGSYYFLHCIFAVAVCPGRWCWKQRSSHCSVTQDHLQLFGKIVRLHYCSADRCPPADSLAHGPPGYFCR